MRPRATLLALALAVTPPLCACFQFLIDDARTPEPDVGALLGAARRWSAPESFGSVRGLGGGISWALDPAFCEQMLPGFWEEQRAVYWELLDLSAPNGRAGCEQLVDAIERAMATWSLNHPHVQFTPDASECAGRRDCETTELYITPFTDSDRAGVLLEAVEGIERLAFAIVDRFSREPALTLLPSGNGTRARTARGVQMEKMTLHFDQDVCWYLDSAQCAHLVGWRARDAVGPLITTLALLVLCWSVVGLWLAHACARATISGKGGKYGAFGLGAPDEVELARAVLSPQERAFLALSRVRPARLSVALCVLLSSMIVWSQMIVPCLRCYDFEATVAHEIGHALGIAHSDTAPQIVLTSDAARADVACGRALDGALELTDTVPPPAPGRRQSLMGSMTAFPERTCLNQDDVDALHALYPDCAEGVDHTPVCPPWPRRPVGLERAQSLLLLPNTLCVAAVLVLTVWLRRRAERLHDRIEQQRDLAPSPSGEETRRLSDPELDIEGMADGKPDGAHRVGGAAGAPHGEGEGGWLGWLSDTTTAAGVMLQSWWPAGASATPDGPSGEGGGGLPDSPRGGGGTARGPARGRPAAAGGSSSTWWVPRLGGRKHSPAPIDPKTGKPMGAPYMRHVPSSSALSTASYDETDDSFSVASPQQTDPLRPASLIFGAEAPLPAERRVIDRVRPSPLGGGPGGGRASSRGSAGSGSSGKRT